MPDGHGVRGAAADLPAINTTVPHPARVWDYWLGGRDNFAVDRHLGDRIRRRFPALSAAAGAGRRFLARSVRHLAGEAGLTQFLDLGSGLPTAGNTHEVARAVQPRSRIVYVDNDPLVVVHARTLLTGFDDGVIDYVGADLRDPAAVLAAAARTLDLSRPVAVMLLGVLDTVPDDTEARRIVTRLMAAVPSGSYLALSHATLDLGGDRNGPATGYWSARTRTRAQVAALLTGLEPVEPGLVPCARWRPDGDTSMSPQWGAVARKP